MLMMASSSSAAEAACRSVEVYLFQQASFSGVDPGLDPIIGGRVALFCIHGVNRMYGALVVTSWTCYGAL